MISNDWGDLWRSQEDGPTINSQEVLMEVRRKAVQLDRTIFWRDVTEGVAALFFAGVTFLVAARIGSPWPWLGGLFATACCAAVYVRMHRTRTQHRTIREDQPLDARLRAEIAKVGAQEELLRSVGRWYVLPLTLAAAGWMASIGLALPVSPEARATATLALAAAGATILFVLGRFVIWLNRRAADQQLRPLRIELEQLLAQVEGG